MIETWDVENKLQLEYSSLYHLQPINMGQSQVECFTSYLLRLAAAHAVYPHTLITNEILPLLNKKYLYKKGEHIHNSVGANWWNGIATSLNGLNPLTEEWIGALELLTDFEDFQFLTMLTYRDVLPYRGLIRKQSAWCSQCYEEWLTNGQAVYIPLLWTLEVVTICVPHSRMLQTSCPFPDCKKSFPAINPRAQIGYCPYCNRWLGTSRIDPNDILDPAILEDQQYIAGVVGDMLAAAPKLSVLPRRENISIVIRRYINEMLNGNAKALADLLKLNHRSIYEIRDGTQLPQLSTLLKLCKLFGITPLQLFIEDVSCLNLNQQDRRKPAANVIPKKKYRQFDKDGVQATLEARIAADEKPPPSMAQVARQLGYDHAFLTKHLPVECQTISQQYAEFNAWKKQERIEKNCEKVRKATREVNAQGYYPSYKRVSKIVRALFKEPAVRTAYAETLYELGYNK